MRVHGSAPYQKQNTIWVNRDAPCCSSTLVVEGWCLFHVAIANSWLRIQDGSYRTHGAKPSFFSRKPQVPPRLWGVLTTVGYVRKLNFGSVLLTNYFRASLLLECHICILTRTCTYISIYFSACLHTCAHAHTRTRDFTLTLWVEPVAPCSFSLRLSFFFLYL